MIAKSVRLSDAPVERKDPAMAGWDLSELRPGKREGRTEILRDLLYA
jgi:hypothetical protein